MALLLLFLAILYFGSHISQIIKAVVEYLKYDNDYERNNEVIWRGYESTMIIVLLIVLGFLLSCKPIEPLYKSVNAVNTMEYLNRRGDSIIVPINSDECIGYKKPYHIITFNRK